MTAGLGRWTIASADVDPGETAGAGATRALLCCRIEYNMIKRINDLFTFVANLIKARWLILFVCAIALSIILWLGERLFSTNKLPRSKLRGIVKRISYSFAASCEVSDQ